MHPSRLVITVVTVLALAPALAHADAPPPDGTRYAQYRFRVDGVAKQSPDHVIVVYPWSLSNGAPTREQTTAEDGQWVSVGRRSPTPALYAVRKTDYEAFAKTYTTSEDYQADPAVDAFLAKAAKCNLAPSPAFTLSEDDSRSAIEEIFVAQTISDTSCVLTNATPPASATPKGGGCAGCTVGDKQIASGVSLAGLLAGLVALGRRGKRRSSNPATKKNHE
jgi:hypothetical protein